MRRPVPSRRAFLTRLGSIAVLASLGLPALAPRRVLAASTAKSALNTVPFWGGHQSGILTPQQTNTYFAAFDLVTAKREDVVSLLKAWTQAAARLTAGLPVDGELAVAPPPSDDSYAAPATALDTGETQGLDAAHLTLTFGFGSGLFVKDGKDRYGLAAQRPEALIDLPKFPGDQLVEDHTGGDLSVQACADDPQVAFHAIRQLARIAQGVAVIRWTQAGFLPKTGKGETPRNLMGFKDGTHNPPTNDPAAMHAYVWAGDEGPAWMKDGSFVVYRRIRIALEHWDRVAVGFQEQTIGRTKASGAPLGKLHERDAMDLDATTKDGDPVIPENSHLRIATAASNDGAEILRRGYSYNDGVNMTAERWPPWHQGLEYDAGLFFCCYQRDPRTGFVKVFGHMAKFDMLNQFTTQVGSGLFACPPGAAPGEFIGQKLFAAS